MVKNQVVNYDDILNAILQLKCEDLIEYLDGIQRNFETIEDWILKKYQADNYYTIGNNSIADLVSIQREGFHEYRTRKDDSIEESISTQREYLHDYGINYDDGNGSNNDDTQLVWILESYRVDNDTVLDTKLDMPGIHSRISNDGERILLFCLVYRMDTYDKNDNGYAVVS